MLASFFVGSSARWLSCSCLVLAAACGDDDLDVAASDGTTTDAGASSGGSSGRDRDAGDPDASDRDASDRDALAADDAASADSGDAAADANVVRNGPAPVELGGAAAFTILAEAAITNVPTSAITGDMGLSPAAATFITGFPLQSQGTYRTTPQVVGKVFTVDDQLPTPSDLTVAVADMHLAYTDAAGRADPTSLDLLGGAIGSQTLAPGLYKWNTAVLVTADVTLEGGPNDTWIMQVSGELGMSADTKVLLRGGARANHVVWQVAGAVTLGARAHAEGNVLGKTGVTLQTGASLTGRIFSQTTAALDHGTVTRPEL